MKIPELLKSITQEINSDGFEEVKYHKHKYKFETDINEPADEEPFRQSDEEIIYKREPEPESEVELIPDSKKRN